MTFGVPPFATLAIAVVLVAMSASVAQANYDIALTAPHTPSPTERVCILGGGPAGLTTAWGLHKKGYTNISVFEKESYVGGKTYTHMADGHAHDLGAIHVSARYSHFTALLKEMGVETQPLLDQIVTDRADKRMESLNKFITKKYGMLRMYQTFMKFSAVMKKYKHYSERPTHADIPDELLVPFTDFIKAEGLEDNKERFIVFLTVYGYGDLSAIPTIYVIKYMFGYPGLSWSQLLKMILHTKDAYPKMVSGGFQLPFIRLAERLNDIVSVNSEVVSVYRPLSDGEMARVKVRDTKTGKEREETCGSVVVAFPQLPGRMESVFDLSAQESELFSKVSFNHYSTVLVKSPEAFASDVGMIGNMVKNGEIDLAPETEPIGLIRYSKETPYVGCYFLTREAQSDDELIAQAKAYLEGQGYVVTEVVSVHQWEYFPHVNRESVAEGFYAKLEGMQGTARTYYTGGLLNFDDCEETMRHTEYLVNTFFPSELPEEASPPLVI